MDRLTNDQLKTKNSKLKTQNSYEPSFTLYSITCLLC